jgi:predicted RNase H-like nuclease
MKFVGIDIAWSERNPSGVAVIDFNGTLTRASGDVRSNDDLCEFAGLEDHGDAVVAIDAPLIVKNATKQRTVERELTKIFGPYDAGPYPANLSNPAFQQGGRIQQFVRQLESLGFKHQPNVQKQQPQRVFLEVFPTPAQVILFPCSTHNGHTHCRPLRYKHKPGRSWLEVQCEWDMYRARLRSLQTKVPTFKFSSEVSEALSIDVSELTGVRYKILDDLADGIFCAYLAYYFWHWGDERSGIIGDMNDGYVALPRCELPNCRIRSK